MKIYRSTGLFIVLNWLIFSFCNEALSQVASPAPAKKKPSAEKKLFESDEVLGLILRGNLNELLKDRTGTPKDHSFILSYYNEDSTEVNMSVEIKTRGHFRRAKENCVYPPLLIQFPKEGSQLSSVFREQKKIKLVMPCRGDDFVIREWLVYKIYNLVAPESFRTRLVTIVLEDAATRKPSTPFYGLLVEEERQMAKRNKLVSVERKIKPQYVEQETFLNMTVFQYLVGNTDWSIEYMQNIKFLAKDSMNIPLPVPYDFDHAGIVGAPYARPAEELEMSSVRQRRYRGYCIKDLKAFEDVIAHFNKLKKAIYSLYEDCPLLEAKYIKNTIKYLDDFYETINTRKEWQREFSYPCDKTGTGGVVIKGLKDD